MPTDLMQFIALLKNGNPQQTMINMLSQMSNGNPVLSNLLQLAKAGDTKSIEQVARNIVKEKGMDFDKEFQNFKQNLKF